MTREYLLLFAVACFLKFKHVAANINYGNPGNLNFNRTDFCSVSSSLMQGTVSLRSALNGLTVTTAIDTSIDPFLLTIDPVTALPIGGLLFSIQNMIASRGGFTFQYLLVPPPPSGMTSKTRLSQILPFVDIHGMWTYDTALSRQSGIGFTQQVVDASLVLVTLTTVPTSKYSSAIATFFLAPFSYKLWLIIAVVIFVNGYFYWQINRREMIANEEELRLTWSMYLSFSTFTGNQKMVPQHKFGMVLNVAYSLFLILIIAMYTASLTQILVNRASGAVGVTSIEDANRRQATVCAIAASQSAITIQNQYPGIRLEAKKMQSAEAVVQAMRNGRCSAALLANIEWLAVAGSLSANENCLLKSVQQNIIPFTGSFPYLNDFSSKCTSIVGSVISNILVEMEMDGSLQTLIQSAIYGGTGQYSTPALCGPPLPSTLGVGAGVYNTSKRQIIYPMNRNTMSGIFIVYAVFVGIAFYLWNDPCWASCTGRRFRNKSDKKVYVEEQVDCNQLGIEGEGEGAGIVQQEESLSASPEPIFLDMLAVTMKPQQAPQISALETALTFLQESQLPKVNAHMDLEVGDTIKVDFHGFYISGTVLEFPRRGKVKVDFGDSVEVFSTSDCVFLRRNEDETKLSRSDSAE